MTVGRALIKVGYACNNGCLFCHAAGSQPRQSPAGAVEAKLELAARLGCSMAVLSGGEPTLRPELAAWARRAGELGLAFGLITNGRMLAYEALAGELAAAGLSYAQVSLHAGEAAEHDRLTRAESFHQTVAGVERLHGLGVEVTVNTVLTRGGRGLRRLVDLLAPLKGLRFKVSMVEPKGEALDRFDALVPDLDEAAARARELLQYAGRQAPSLARAHEGFPLCLMPGLTGLAGGLREEGFTLMSEADEEGFFAVDTDNREHPEPCAACALRGQCPGVYREYLARRPAPALCPEAAA